MPRRAAGLLLIALVFALLARWSWGRWTDVQVDAGNELYTAWQLSEGLALYRDIAHRNGPLSAYLNALWFTLFGVSIRTLVLANLAILAGVCALTHRLLRLACDRATATLGCLVLLSVFAFSQYLAIGNYNYVTPYHAAQTHGLALGLAMLAALLEAVRRAAPRLYALAGACLGLAFLTKAELFVPALMAAAAGLAAAATLPRFRAARDLGLFAAGAVAPVIAFFGFLAAQMPASQALRGVLGNWVYLDRGVAADRFYRVGAGLDDVPGNLAVTLGAGAAIAAVLAVAALIAWSLPARAARPRAAGALALLAFAGLVAFSNSIPWLALGRGLPVVSAAAVGVLGVACWRARGDADAMARRLPLALWSVYALGLLGKMILNARIPHYGFVLAMPATLLLVACAFCELPRLLERRIGRGAPLRALSLALVAAAALAFLRVSDRRYARKTAVFGSGGDAVRVVAPGVNPRVHALAIGMQKLEAHMGPGETLLVLPEGAGLNYWLRRRNPSRYNLFLPTEIHAAGGESVVLDDLRAHPPDWIAVVPRGFREFGVGPFGVDPRNGRRIMEWVRRHYRAIEDPEAVPYRDEGLGVLILRRESRESGSR